MQRKALSPLSVIVPVDLIDRSESGRVISRQSSKAFQMLYTVIVAELEAQITVPKERYDDVTQHTARPLSRLISCSAERLTFALRFDRSRLLQMTKCDVTRLCIIVDSMCYAGGRLKLKSNGAASSRLSRCTGMLSNC